MKPHYPVHRIAALAIIGCGISVLAVQDHFVAGGSKKAGLSASNQQEIMLAQRGDGRTCRTVIEDGEKRIKCCASWANQMDGNNCVYN